MTIPSVTAAPPAVTHDVKDGAHRDTTPAAAGPSKDAAAKAGTRSGHDQVPASHKTVSLPEFPHYELAFRLDEERGRVVVQVIDSKTGTVLRSVPPDQVGKTLHSLPDPRGVLHDSET